MRPGTCTSSDNLDARYGAEEVRRTAVGGDSGPSPFGSGSSPRPKDQVSLSPPSRLTRHPGRGRLNGSEPSRPGPRSGRVPRLTRAHRVRKSPGLGEDQTHLLQRDPAGLPGHSAQRRSWAHSPSAAAAWEYIRLEAQRTRLHVVDRRGNALCRQKYFCRANHWPRTLLSRTGVQQTM